jgi:hypothetical protein
MQAYLSSIVGENLGILSRSVPRWPSFPEKKWQSASARLHFSTLLAYNICIKAILVGKGALASVHDRIREGQDCQRTLLKITASRG